MKTIFAVFAVNAPDYVERRLQELFPDDHLSIGPGQWLVAAEGTAKSVSDGLGVNDEPPPRPDFKVLVVSFSGYYGRMTPNEWEWIRSKWGSA